MKRMFLAAAVMAIAATAGADQTFSWIAIDDPNVDSVRVYMDTDDNLVGENFDLVDEDGRNYITVPSATDGLSHRYFARAYSATYDVESDNSDYADVRPEIQGPGNPPPIDQIVMPVRIQGFIDISVTPVE